MLKWTGGSRRTVSTSRKSTQSKQRQYFEQKRRLQQTPGTENPSETNKPDQPSDVRSLDILSFVNLATVAQNKESVHAKNDGSTQALFNPSKLPSPAALKKFVSMHPTKPCEAYDHDSNCLSQEENGDYSKLSPAMAVKKIISGLSNKPKELGSIPGASSCHELFAGQTLNSKEKVGDFMEIPSSIPLKSKSSDTKQKGKSTMYSEVSLFDILDDGDSERNLVRKSCHEAYVAFSVKGLGKVEVETPPQSPVPYQRGCPDPPQRAAKCTRWNKEFESIPFGIKMVPDSVLQDTNLINDVRQSERIRDHGPFIDNTVFTKETHFEDICFPDLFDKFDESPDSGEDGAFDGHIHDLMWGATYEEIANTDLPRKRKDRSWDTNLYKQENFNGASSSNENVFHPTLIGFEEYSHFPTLRTETSTQRSDLYSARAVPSCSPITMENKNFPTDSHSNRGIPKSKKKSDFDVLFSQPVWPFKDEVADLLDTTSLRSGGSCYSTRVKEVENYSFQSCPEKHKIYHMDAFQIDSNLHLNSLKFKNIPSRSHDKSTCRTKSSTSGSKLEKTSLLIGDMFQDSDLFPDCAMYKKSKKPSKSFTMEQRSGTDLDFHANREGKHAIFNYPESELPNKVQSSYVGEVELDIKEGHGESARPKCESEKFSDEAENVGHTEADKSSFEESHLVLEACSNVTPNTPVHSQQFETCNLTQDDCDKSSPFLSQAENQGDEKGKSDVQFQVMLQSYVFQLLCVQKVLEASGKDENKGANETGKASICILNATDKTEREN